MGSTVGYYASHQCRSLGLKSSQPVQCSFAIQCLSDFWANVHCTEWKATVHKVINDWICSSQDFSVSSTEASPNTTFRYSLMSQWTPVQVSQWLEKQELGQYAQQFLEKGVNGQQLLQLDSTKMKVCVILYGIYTMPASISCWCFFVVNLIIKICKINFHLLQSCLFC